MEQRIEQKDLFDSLIINESLDEMRPILPKTLNTKEFKKLINCSDISDSDSTDEPQPKKAKPKSPEMWQSNYVSIESVLPLNHSLLVTKLFIIVFLFFRFRRIFKFLKVVFYIMKGIMMHFADK